jgi:hypothetical protein
MSRARRLALGTEPMNWARQNRMCTPGCTPLWVSARGVDRRYLIQMVGVKLYALYLRPRCASARGELKPKARRNRAVLRRSSRSKRGIAPAPFRFADPCFLGERARDGCAGSAICSRKTASTRSSHLFTIHAFVYFFCDARAAPIRTNSKEQRNSEEQIIRCLNPQEREILAEQGDQHCAQWQPNCP